MPIEATSTPSVANTAVEDTQRAWFPEYPGRVGNDSSQSDSNRVEQWNPINAFQSGDPGASLLPALTSLAEKVFSGIDKGALNEGTMGALGGLANGGVLQFALKALPLLLQCQNPADFIQAGLKLASDPAFPAVIEKMFDVASSLAASSA